MWSMVHLTWGSYIVVAIALLVVYYVAIGLVYYRRDISQLLAASKAGGSLKPYASSLSSSSHTAEPDMGLYNTVHALMEDCKPVFQAAVSQQLEKTLVLEALHLRVQRYPQIKGTAFQVAMTNHITQELEHRLSMTLTDEEANDLWL